MKKNILYKYGPAVLGVLNLDVANGNIWMIFTGLTLVLIALMDFFSYDG